MVRTPARKRDTTAFNALSARVYDRLHELTDIPEEDFNRLYRAALIEQWRGRNAASTGAKSEFIKAVLDVMVERGFIASWESIGGTGRADYKINLLSGRVAVMEAKGSMDGNSATILERPSYADEMVIWTITTNPMSDVVASMWSGIHSRISPEYIVNGKRVDVIIAWDHLESSVQLCPELGDLQEVEIAGERLPPPCLYLLPHELPIVGVCNPVKARAVGDSEFASAICECFGIPHRMVGQVEFEVGSVGNQLARRTTVTFSGRNPRTSKMTPIRRDLTAYMNAVAFETQA